MASPLSRNARATADAAKVSFVGRTQYSSRSSASSILCRRPHLLSGPLRPKANPSTEIQAVSSRARLGASWCKHHVVFTPKYRKKANPAGLHQKSGDSRQAVGSVAIEAHVLMKSHLSSQNRL